MIIAYYDESGDDGYPASSTELFVLTSVYFSSDIWQTNFDAFSTFRRTMRTKFQFPYKMEMHTNGFLLNKKPFNTLRLSDDQRVDIVTEFCKMISSLELKIINIVINKRKINTANYPVLENAFTYSIQRIQNDITSNHPGENFMIISDPGRIGMMRQIARKIRRLNFIPSKFNGSSINKPISSLIEDPLQKESEESFFIQITDLVSFVVFQYEKHNLLQGNLPARMPSTLTHNKIIEWMNILVPKLNRKASGYDPTYGIVCYPH